jgi:Fe-S cluster assembly protein SufD
MTAAISTETFDERALATLPPAAGFVDALRRRAFESYRSLPIPSQETEEWRYTDLSELDMSFVPHVPGHAGGPPGRPSAVHTTSNQDLARLGVLLTDLDEAADKHPELVEPHLHRLVPSDRTKFTALHGAFRVGGTFLYVPPGASVQLPLQTVTHLDEENAAVFPHTLIVVGEDAEVSFIDRYQGPELRRALSVAITEIVIGPAARVRYTSIQEWGEGVVHLGIQRAELDRDAELRSLAIGFGASLARAEAETVLAGRGAFSEMLGVYFADGEQHFDHRSEQDHVAPDCTSDLLYKGALRDRTRGVYSGWVHVRPGAQKTNAMQTCRNIILSEEAFARAIPNLEIEANDVRCGHAASVGPVDDEQLFYLMSRGIPRAEAEKLIVFGFFNEVLDRVTIDEVRAHAEDSIDAELEREF